MNALNEKISKIGVVPVIKLNHPERDAAGLAKALCAGGVPVAEVTFRAAGADKAIRIMKETCPEMLVGAGTVTNTAQIDKVIEAGGDFIVSPGFDPELVEYAQKKGIPVYPGCTTASEYHQALKFGLELIKFFPAEQSGGLAKIKALAAPFPMFKVMPTERIARSVSAAGEEPGSVMVSASLRPQSSAAPPDRRWAGSRTPSKRRGRSWNSSESRAYRRSR